VKAGSGPAAGIAARGKPGPGRRGRGRKGGPGAVGGRFRGGTGRTGGPAAWRRGGARGASGGGRERAALRPRQARDRGPPIIRRAKRADARARRAWGWPHPEPGEGRSGQANHPNGAQTKNRSAPHRHATPASGR
jgi:hypothetical protein